MRATRRPAPWRTTASAPIPCSRGAGASRTASSSSPAERSRTDPMATPPLIRVIEREALVYSRLWRGLAFSTFVRPALYLAAMGIGLGGPVSARSGSVDGLTYLDFVAPGLLVASAAQLAASESMWPVLGGAKWMRQYHGVVATPIAPGELYGGFVLWTALQAMLGATAFLFVAALLGAIPSLGGVLAIPAAGLCAG